MRIEDYYSPEAKAQIKALEAVEGQVRMKRDAAKRFAKRAAEQDDPVERTLPENPDFYRGRADGLESVLHTLGELSAHIGAAERQRVRDQKSVIKKIISGPPSSSGSRRRLTVSDALVLKAIRSHSPRWRNEGTPHIECVCQCGRLLWSADGGYTYPVDAKIPLRNTASLAFPPHLEEVVVRAVAEREAQAVSTALQDAATGLSVLATAGSALVRLSAVQDFLRGMAVSVEFGGLDDE